jgi:hypothetical protein
LFQISSTTKILDLGSEDGSHMASLIQGSEFRPGNIYIADIDAAAIHRGHKAHGFTPVLISAFGPLPFSNSFFDIVYCSSVIEHVTIPFCEVWNVSSGAEFRRRALVQQTKFAREIDRVGRQYFVQTPNRRFLIESHTWLPFMGWVPRRMLIPFLRVSNKLWIKETAPDWNLLSLGEMKRLFPGSQLAEEKTCGLVKSIMAVRTEDPLRR